jgi:hypothetical protein
MCIWEWKVLDSTIIIFIALPIAAMLYLIYPKRPKSSRKHVKQQKATAKAS